MGEGVEKTVGEIVSRLTMAVVGLALMFGGVRVLHWASVSSANYYREHRPYHVVHDTDEPAGGDSDSRMLYYVGWGLLSAGLLLGVGSVVPVSVIERIYSPPEL